MESLLSALSSAEMDLPRMLEEKRDLAEEGSRVQAWTRKGEIAADPTSDVSRSLHELDRFWPSSPCSRTVTAVNGIAAPVFVPLAKSRKIDTLVRLGSRKVIRTLIENLTVLQAEIADLDQPSSGLVEVRNVVHALLSGQMRPRAFTQEIGALLAKNGAGEAAQRFELGTRMDAAELRSHSPEHLPGVVSPAW